MQVFVPLLFYLICLFLPYGMRWCARNTSATVFPLKCAGGCACAPYICIIVYARACGHHQQPAHPNAPSVTPAFLTGLGAVDFQRPSGRSSRVRFHTNVPSHRQVNVCQAVTAAPRSHKSVKDRGLGKREGWFVHRYRRHPTTLRYALQYEQCMHASVSCRRLSASTTKCRAAVFRIHLGAPDDFIFFRFP